MRDESHVLVHAHTAERLRCVRTQKLPIHLQILLWNFARFLVERGSDVRSIPCEVEKKRPVLVLIDVTDSLSSEQNRRMSSFLNALIPSKQRLNSIACVG